MAIAAMATARAPLPPPQPSVSKLSSPLLRVSVTRAAFGENSNRSEPVAVAIPGPGRRQLLKGLVLAPLVWGPPSSEAKDLEVGSYLPPSPSDPSFVFFKASPRDTPALRAGNLLLLVLMYLSVERLS